MSRKRPEKHVCPTRRQVLGMLGSAAIAPAVMDPFKVLLRGLVDGLILDAQASTTGATKPRNFINIYMPGGVPRWVFDCPLTPYPSMSMVRNGCVNTRFTDNGSTLGPAAYVTTPVNAGGVTVNMPWMWSYDVPTPGGGTTPLANLLAHMIMIRGVNMGIDGHSTNSFKQIRPSSSAPSLSGLVADGATTPIPAVGLQFGLNSVYKSGKGIGQVIEEPIYSNSDPLTHILAPFRQQSDGLSSTYISRKAAMQTAISQAMSALGSYAQSASPGSAALYSVRGKAETLLNSSLGDLRAAYSGLYAKYRALIQSVVGMSLPGISDKPIPLSVVPDLQGNGVLAAMKTEAADGNGGYVYATNSDLRSIITAQTYFSLMAENFAVAEYLIRNGLSSSVVFGCGSTAGLFFQGQKGTSSSTLSLPDTYNSTTNVYNGFWGGDEHEGGAIVSLIVNTFQYLALGACLTELVNVLKGTTTTDGLNLFNETVIQVSSEFSRDPRDNLSGSDHGWQGNSTCIISGAITQPLVVGNVSLSTAISSGNTASSGTWGYSAPVNVNGVDQLLTIGHMTSTVATVLRVDPPLPNNGSLITENTAGGGYSPTVELAKNK